LKFDSLSTSTLHIRNAEMLKLKYLAVPAVQ
jgi:hypothetical protein